MSNVVDMKVKRSGCEGQKDIAVDVKRSGCEGQKDIAVDVKHSRVGCQT